MTNIRKDTISGFKWVSVFTLLNVILNPIVLIVLSYFLSTDEFGRRSIITIILGLGTALTQFGVAQAIIQKEKVTNKELSSLLWASFIFGIILFLVVYGSSQQISNLYDDKSLENLIKLTSIVFLLEPIGAIFGAVLEKKLLFKNLSIFNIARLLVSSIIMILFAYLGFGVYSIIIGQLLGIVIFLILIIIFTFRKKIWNPKFHFNLTDCYPYYEFGIYVTGKNLLNFIGRDADEIIIGKVLGMEVLGIYHFAKQIIQRVIDLITTTVNKVTYPIYSEIKNNYNIEHFKNYYLKLTLMISTVGTPLFGLFIISTPFIIDIIFSDQWNDSIVIIQILAIKGTIDIISAGFASSVLYAFNKPKLVFKIDLIMTPIRIFAIYLASLHSLNLVAVTFLVMVFIKFLLLQNSVNRIINLSWLKYSKQITNNYIIVGLLTVTGVIITSQFYNLYIFFIIIVGFSALYLVYLQIFKKEIVVEFSGIILRK